MTCPNCKVDPDDLIEHVRAGVWFCNRCALTWWVDAQGVTLTKRGAAAVSDQQPPSPRLTGQ